MKKTVLYICLLLFCAPLLLNAQRPAPDTAKAEGKLLEIISAERLNVITVDSLHKYFSLAGKAHVKQEKTDFYADSMVLNEIDNSLEAFGNIHINDADSVHTYSQYLKYLGKEKKAFLKKKVKLTDGKGELTTDELEYDVTTKVGTYLKGGKLVNKKSVLTSKEGYYYGDTRDVYFKQKVVLIDPEYKVVTDTLQYNINTEIATFTSPTIIYSDSGRRTIKTRQGYFDMKNKKGILNKRSVVEDSTYTFTADDMAVDDSTKLGEFRGNAVYRGKDTAQGFDMIANNIKTDRKKDIMLATEQPILIIKQGKDSIFVSADTFYTARLTDLEKVRKVPVVRLDSSIKKIQPVDSTSNTDSSRNKYFEAYYHVRIFSDSLQTVCDSMFYSLSDSVFRLFKKPVVWAKENQITGDTIYLFVKDKKPERLLVYENAMAINKVDSTLQDFYNQVKGTTLNAWFEDGKIHSMRVKGNAENIYYGQDEKNRFIGVNKSSSDIINVLFDKGKPSRISFLSHFDGILYPMHQVDHNTLRLRGFNWLNAIRPKSKFDILSPN
ncbi:MAG: hypothetical protein KGO92_08870 [Bacteroidota bacterium]|nr:hypothetical protein [Bacteroidota bacterium]